MTGGGFTVVMSDLQHAASTFDDESGKLRGLVPAGGPACPDGGGQVDGALRAVLSDIGSLTGALAGALAAHGQKLAQAHANYAHAEITGVQLCHGLAAELGTGRQGSGAVARSVP